MLQERILIGGSAGTGKTYAWLTIARNLSKNKFYVIDPDDGVRRVAYETNPTKGRVFPDLSNVEYYMTPTWYTTSAEDYSKKPTATKIQDSLMTCYKSGVADAWKLIKPKLKEGDWVVIEHMGNIWARVQDAFADEVFEKDIGQYFLEKRKALKAGAKKLEALEGWTDWVVINKMHNDDFIVPVCFESPAHVLMTTAVTIAQPNTREDADIKSFYSGSDLRFEGQKHNIFRSQTFLILKQEGRGKDRKYILNTFQKDRGRVWVENEEWDDFYLQYLCLVANWS